MRNPNSHWTFLRGRRLRRFDLLRSGAAMATLAVAWTATGQEPRQLPAQISSGEIPPPSPATALPPGLFTPPLPAPRATPFPQPRSIRVGPAGVPRKPEAPALPRDRDQGQMLEEAKESETEIEVGVGRAKLFRSKQDLRRIVVARPSVADVQLLDADQPNPKLVNVYGLSFGTTDLTFFDDRDHPTTFRVRVKLDAADLQSRIKETLPGAKVRIRQVGSQVILEGQVPDAKTMADVLQLVNTELQSQSAPIADLAPAAPAGGGAGPGGGAPAGAAPPGGATGGGPPVGSGPIVINRVFVPGPRQVLLRVKIAELDRTALRNFGVNFQKVTSRTNIRQQVGPIPGNNQQLIGIFDSGKFSLFINALRANSLVNILAEPNLMTLDGQPARFQAGGQYPYPVPQSSALPGGTAVVTIAFKDFGAILQFVPHIQSNDVIRLDVEPVFSQLDFSFGSTVPGLNVRSARTVVELREGQTLAIGGLLQKTTTGSTLRVPGLGDLPVFGQLFSVNNVRTSETELVVLVTPELVAPMEACDVPPGPGERVLEPNDLEFFFLGRIEGKTGHPFRATIQEHDVFSIMKHFQSENRWVVGPHGHAD